MALERSTIFRQPRILGVGFFGAGLWTGWVFFVTSPLPKGLRPLDSHNGAPRPLDPSARLARLATASIDMSFYFVS